MITRVSIIENVLPFGIIENSQIMIVKLKEKTITKIYQLFKNRTNDAIGSLYCFSVVKFSWTVSTGDTANTKLTELHRSKCQVRCVLRTWLRMCANGIQLSKAMKCQSLRKIWFRFSNRFLSTTSKCGICNMKPNRFQEYSSHWIFFSVLFMFIVQIIVYIGLESE